MRVAIVGRGGREAALAWACSRRGHEVRVAGGVDEVLASPPDLVVVGPEQALADGAADACAEAGVPCFGPTAALARLETSKGHARVLATQLGIPQPRFFRSDHHHDAIKWWRELGGPVVVKLDGLAGGKGVVVPANPSETDAAIRSLVARGPIVVEERLSGPECSLMAVCDGTTAWALPLAQDHKRIGEGDHGPNTGGMGAYAPAPVGHDPADLTATFVQPVLDHLRGRGERYVGVLYAGLMLTPAGPRLIEYNCRLGDPEAQAVLPLLELDLDLDVAELLLACHHGRLAAFVAGHPGATRPPSGAACTVVAAAPGYPDRPVLGGVVRGLGQLGAPEPDATVVVFPAGTDGDVVTGGRVVAVTGLGQDLASARARAYERMGAISFDGMQVRRDIGWRAAGAGIDSYASTGVDIDEGARAVDAMAAAVRRTHGPSVLRGLGSFGGAFSGRPIAALDDPVLVASTDGVGTKVELAARLGRYRGIGHDIVNHCVGDVLVQGARPLFFLDYVASSRLDAGHVAEVVTGMAEACEAVGCALLGGETAEMPGVYAPGAFDVAGTLVGLVERRDLLPRDDVAPGDVLVGVRSSGPHTNGYSLLRRVFEWLPMDAVPDGLDRPIGDALLEPHRSYLDLLAPALATGRVKALAHVTGGGLPENLPRALPAGCGARVELGSWPVPPLFTLVASAATALGTRELHRTLNMGIGMVVVCAAADAGAVQQAVGETTWVIGEVVAGEPVVELV